MGSVIAIACLNAGCRVQIIEQNQTAANKAREDVSKLMNSAVNREIIFQEQFHKRLASPGTSEEFYAAQDADLVIEAIR